VGPAGQEGDGGSAGPAPSFEEVRLGEGETLADHQADPVYPVEEWAINQDPPVDLRVAKVAIRKEFKKDFGWLQDWRQLAELPEPQASDAITALEAIYLDPGEKG
jgi:hypothetical protein